MSDEPKSRPAFQYIVLAYDEPDPSTPTREHLLLLGVYEGANAQEACDKAAQEFPPRVGDRRTFAATVASKWREYDYGAETRIEVTGVEAGTHPADVVTAEVPPEEEMPR